MTMLAQDGDKPESPSKLLKGNNGFNNCDTSSGTIVIGDKTFELGQNRHIDAELRQLKDIAAKESGHK